jgi:hypothetical protein
MANGLIGGEMDPDWVMSHQCVYARKSDCGPAFPMHEIRNAVFVDTAVGELDWLAHHPMAPDASADFDEYYEHIGEDRMEPLSEFVRWVKPSKDVQDLERDPAWIAQQLYRLGFNAGPEAPDKDRLRKMVRWFQRSTGAYKKGNSEWILTPDGICGPKTEAGLKRRMSQMGFE